MFLVGGGTVQPSQIHDPRMQKKKKRKEKDTPSCASSCRKAITLYHDIKPYLWTTPSGMIDPLQNL